MKGYYCHCCELVFSRDDAHQEPMTVGGPGTVFQCPACYDKGSIEEIFICPECQRERPEKGEDLGKNCLDAEQDALMEMQLDQFDERSAA